MSYPKSRSHYSSVSDSSSDERSRTFSNPFSPHDRADSHLQPTATTVSGRHSSLRSRRPTLGSGLGSVRSIAVTSSEDENEGALQLHPSKRSFGAPLTTALVHQQFHHHEDVIPPSAPPIPDIDHARYRVTVEDAPEDDGVDNVARYTSFAEDYQSRESARQYWTGDRRLSGVSQQRPPSFTNSAVQMPDPDDHLVRGNNLFVPPASHWHVPAVHNVQERYPSAPAPRFLSPNHVPVPPEEHYSQRQYQHPTVEDSYTHSDARRPSQVYLAENGGSDRVFYAGPGPSHRSHSRLSGPQIAYQSPPALGSESDNSQYYDTYPQDPANDPYNPGGPSKGRTVPSKGHRYQSFESLATNPSPPEQELEEEFWSGESDIRNGSGLGPGHYPRGYSPLRQPAWKNHTREQRSFVTGRESPYETRSIHDMRSASTRRNRIPHRQTTEPIVNNDSSYTSEPVSSDDSPGPPPAESHANRSEHPRSMHTSAMTQETKSRSADKTLHVDTEPSRSGRHMAERTRSLFASRIQGNNNNYFVAPTSWADPGEQITFQLAHKLTNKAASPSGSNHALNLPNSNTANATTHENSQALQALLLEYCAGGNSKDAVTMTQAEQSSSPEAAMEPALVWM